MKNLPLILAALLPHVCCLLAAFTGCWSVARTASCHSDPTGYAVGELCGLALAAGALWALATGRDRLWRWGLVGLLALSLLCSSVQSELWGGIFWSGLSKAGQGYLLWQASRGILLRLGLPWPRGCCPKISSC